MAIVFAAIILRIYCFKGFTGLDSAEYARIAKQMVDGTYSIGTYEGPPVFSLRVGILFPTVLLFYFFGVSEWLMVFFPFCLSILSTLLAYACARHLFGPSAGLIAAAIWAIFPADISYNATKLLPDLPSAFFASLGVVCILFLIRLRTECRLTILLGGVFTGSLFGVSWLCKANVIFLIPFCILLLFITIKANWKRDIYLWVGIAIGSSGLLFAEMLVYYSLTGDLMFRFHEIERNSLLFKDGFFTEGSRWGWPEGGSYYIALIKRLFLIGPKTIFLNSQFLYLPLLGVIASLYALYCKDKLFLIPGLWLITLCFMYSFSTTSFSYYAPMVLYQRYLYPIYLPAIVLVSGFIVKLLFYSDNNQHGKIYKGKRIWGIILIVFLVIIGGKQTFYSIKHKSDWSSEVRAISNMITPSDQTYADIISVKALEFFWRYPDDMKTIDFEGINFSSEIQRGSYIFINPKYVNWLVLNEGMWVNKYPIYKKPYFYEKIPSNWKEIWKDGSAKLYQVE